MVAEDRTVSAIIPVRNGALYLAEAIRSVLDQTYPVAECLVVDDGSTDETPDIVRSFGSAVRYLRIDPSGVSAARNAGTRASEGALIAFLDADDVWLPEKLASQIAALRTNRDAGIVYTGLRLIDETGNPIGLLNAPPGELALRNTLLIEGTGVSVAQTSLVPREVFEEVGGFDEELSTSADADFACRVALAHRVLPVDEHLVLYRLHRGQMHKDPSATLHDRDILFAKIFADDRLPSELKNKRRRATANLYLSIASRHFKRRDWRSLLVYALRAFFLRPDRVMVALIRFPRLARRWAKAGSPRR